MGLSFLRSCGLAKAPAEVLVTQAYGKTDAVEIRIGAVIEYHASVPPFFLQIVLAHIAVEL